MPRMGSSQQIDLQQGTVHSLEVSWPEKRRERVWWEQPEIDPVQSLEQVAPDAGEDINPWTVCQIEKAQDGSLLFGREHGWVKDMFYCEMQKLDTVY